MELWIRSQDKETFLKTNIIALKKFEEGYGIINYIDINNWFGLGLYKTKERALEALDEIQSKIKQQFIVKPSAIKSLKDIDREENRLTWKYDKEFIMQDSGFEIVPINNEAIVYEMPEE